jgi:hypothetical protein
MTEVSFELTPADLAAYQYAVRDRLTKLAPKQWWETDAIRATVLFGIAAVTYAGLDWAAPWLLGRPLELVEFLIGFWLGLLLAIGLMWMTYWDQRRRMVRPDGPTLGEHVVRLTNEGVSINLRDSDARYTWRAFEDITEQRGLISLWLEPGIGLIIPAHAFAKDTERVQFFSELKTRMTESNLPRAGSFA